MRLVSLVLTTRNRSQILARTLERLREVETPGVVVRMIVADNGSTDDTQATIADAKTRGDLTSVCVETPGKNRALNRALEFAEGELIVFTDDDVLPATDWLRELIAATERWPEADIFGGQTRLAVPPGAPDWLFELQEFSMNLARYAPMGEEGLTDRTPYGPNFAIRPHLLDAFRFEEAVGPDGTRVYAMGSEVEFLRRAHKGGHQMVYVPSAKLWHVVRPEQLELKELAGRAHRMGRGMVRLEGPNPHIVHLFGAERWIWRCLLRAGADRVFSTWGSEPARVEALLRYHRNWGMIAEHRARTRKAGRVHVVAEHET